MLIRKIEVLPYDPAWPEQFQVEAGRLTPVLGKNLLCRHPLDFIMVPG